MSETAAALCGHQEARHDGVVESVSMRGEPGTKLLTVEVVPADRPVRTTGLVICPSYFELKLFQRVEIDLLRRAARAGWPGVYVQPPGCGDSEGDPLACTIADRVAAARAAGTRLLAGGAARVCFIGARLGGSVALLAAGTVPSAAAAAWDPVLDGEEYWRHTRRFARVASAVARRPRRDVDALLADDPGAIVLQHRIGRRQLDDLRSLDTSSSGCPTGPVLVVSLNDVLARRASSVGGAGVDHVSLGPPKPRHVLRMRSGETQSAADSTLDWLERRLP